MKIYPSKHIIKSCARPPISSIPIGHIEKELYPSNIVIEKQPEFAKNTEKLISPYDVFDTNEQIFFNAAGDKTSVTLKRNGSQYAYEPNYLTEFSPDEFTAKALLKKNLTYNSSQKYNLRIAVNETDTDFAWSKQLISIFGDAPLRGICPASISVNSMSMQPISLINSSYSETDFVFVKSQDGSKLISGTIDLDTIMSTHTNVWLAIKDNGNIFDKAKGYASKNSVPILYDAAFSIPDSYGYKVKTVPIFPFPTTAYNITFPFSGNPIVLLEKPNGAYIIISHENLFSDLKTNAKFIYEVLMSVYLKSYVLTKAASSWITNDPVDYLGTTRCPFGKTHIDIYLDELIDNTNCVIDSYELIDILVVSDSAIFLKKDNNNRLFFEKISGTVDPQKSNDVISIYTTKNTVIQYKTEVIKEIESNIQIDAEITDTGYCSVTVNPFKSSSHQLVIKDKNKFQIKEADRTYCLAALPIDQDGVSVLMLIDSAEYIADGSTLLAKISVDYEATENCSDVRILGGGLPESCKADYEMLDIGNLYGRPYRVGTSMIIRLPERLEIHDTYIQEAINKNKNAADLAVIVYEKK